MDVKYLRTLFVAFMLLFAGTICKAVTIKVGGSTTLTAPSVSGTTGILYTWDTNSYKVVSLGSATSRTCKVTGESVGTATITCTVKWQTYNSTTKSYVYESGNVKKQTYSVTVTAPDPTSISLNSTSISMTVGDTRQLNASISPSSASQSVTWSVYSGSSCVSVSSSGLVTAKAAGTATVRATSTAKSSVYKDCSVTVSASEPVTPVSPTSISLNLTNVSIEVGESQQLTATVYPSGASQSVSWEVYEGNDIISVSSTGLVTAKSVGTGVVRAKSTADTSVYQDCEVAVKDDDPQYFYIGGKTNWSVKNKSYPFKKLSDGITWELTMNLSDYESSDGFIIGVRGIESSYDYEHILIPDSEELTGTLCVGKNTGQFYLSHFGLTSYTIRIVPSTMSYSIELNYPKDAGTPFTAKTVEGVEVTYYIIDGDQMTCQVGGNPRGYEAAISQSTKGQVTIPEHVNGYTVTRIGDYAFYECSSLSSVIVPNTVTNLGEWSFKESSISSVTLPDRLEIIGAHAFSRCEFLNEIVIPEGVTALVKVFGGNISLKKLSLPSTLSYIYENEAEFSNCKQLRTIISNIKKPFDINDETFIVYRDTTKSGIIHDPVVYNNATLYVPKGTKTLYENTDGWKLFRNIVEMDDNFGDAEVTDISEIDNVVYIEPVESCRGGQTVLSVKMKNTVPIQTIQFDLYLPKGIDVQVNEDDELITASKERAKKFSYFQSSIQSDGALRLLAQSSTTNIEAGDGEICQVKIKIPEDMEEGDYPITLKNILLVENDNTSHSPSPNIVKTKLTITSYIPGDANSDRNVNAIDFNMIGNFILGRSQIGFNEKAADVNGDGTVNAIDFNMIGNMILNGGTSSSRQT